jgi:hypothetical protein
MKLVLPYPDKLFNRENGITGRIIMQGCVGTFQKLKRKQSNEKRYSRSVLAQWHSI